MRNKNFIIFSIITVIFVFTLFIVNYINYSKINYIEISKKVLYEKFESIYDEGLKISSNWILIENPSNPELESYVFGGFLQQKEVEGNKMIDTSKWVNFKLDKHNISLKQPKAQLLAWWPAHVSKDVLSHYTP